MGNAVGLGGYRLNIHLVCSLVSWTGYWILYRLCHRIRNLYMHWLARQWYWILYECWHWIGRMQIEYYVSSVIGLGGCQLNMKLSAHRIELYIQYPLLEWRIMTYYSLDKSYTCIKYLSTNAYYTVIMYNLPDVHWDILNNIMSQYYLHYYHILRLNSVKYLNCIDMLQQCDCFGGYMGVVKDGQKVLES
jgi:hypothetical protein